MSTKVRILNPATGGAVLTSSRNAEYYVASGRARWRGKAIEFIETDFRHVAVTVSVSASRRGYDEVGTMSLNQIRGIPVIAPEKLIRCGRPRRPLE